MACAYMLLWLEAPLQSWGVQSKFDRRDTLDFPTKSGVLGLLCCARGAGGPQEEWLAGMAPLSQCVIAYVPCVDRQGTQVKCLRKPVLRDFHMVGSAYDSADPWQKMLIPKTSEGKPAVGGGTKLTYRYSLQDMAFAVVLEVPEQEAAALAEALQHPVWDIYLGRKHCAPTDFVYRDTFTAHDAAIEAAHALARNKQRMEDFRVMDGEQRNAEGDLLGEVLVLNDIPLNFGTFKNYRDRLVTVITA